MGLAGRRECPPSSLYLAASNDGDPGRHTCKSSSGRSPFRFLLPPTPKCLLLCRHPSRAGDGISAKPVCGVNGLAAVSTRSASYSLVPLIGCHVATLSSISQPAPASPPSCQRETALITSEFRIRSAIEVYGAWKYLAPFLLHRARSTSCFSTDQERADPASSARSRESAGHCAFASRP